MTGRLVAEASQEAIVTHAQIKYLDDVRGEIILPLISISHGVRVDYNADYLIPSNNPLENSSPIEKVDIFNNGSEANLSQSHPRTTNLQWRYL